MKAATKRTFDQRSVRRYTSLGLDERSPSRRTNCLTSSGATRCDPFGARQAKLESTLTPFLKYSQGEAFRLFADADLRVINSWKAPNSEYRLWLLERPPVRFKDIAIMRGNGVLSRVKGVPKWDEWQGLWKLWDQ
jgi:hypothetical protein